MRKVLLYCFGIFLAFVLVVHFSYAQPAPAVAKDKASDAKSAKPETQTAFWAKELPKVIAKVEKRYDINRDEILQTSETKIFLRDVIAQVVAKSSFNVSDSALLKPYDKNKDGIISNIEIEEIKKDLAY